MKKAREQEHKKNVSKQKDKKKEKNQIQKYYFQGVVLKLVKGEGQATPRTCTSDHVCTDPWLVLGSTQQQEFANPFLTCHLFIVIFTSSFSVVPLHFLCHLFIACHTLPSHGQPFDMAKVTKRPPPTLNLHLLNKRRRAKRGRKKEIQQQLK